MRSIDTHNNLLSKPILSLSAAHKQLGPGSLNAQVQARQDFLLDPLQRKPGFAESVRTQFEVGLLHLVASRPCRSVGRAIDALCGNLKPGGAQPTLLQTILSHGVVGGAVLGVADTTVRLAAALCGPGKFTSGVDGLMHFAAASFCVVSALVGLLVKSILIALVVVIGLPILLMCAVRNALEPQGLCIDSSKLDKDELAKTYSAACQAALEKAETEVARQAWQAYQPGQAWQNVVTKPLFSVLTGQNSAVEVVPQPLNPNVYQQEIAISEVPQKIAMSEVPLQFIKDFNRQHIDVAHRPGATPVPLGFELDAAKQTLSRLCHEDKLWTFGAAALVSQEMLNAVYSMLIEEDSVCRGAATYNGAPCTISLNGDTRFLITSVSKFLLEVRMSLQIPGDVGLVVPSCDKLVTHPMGLSLDMTVDIWRPDFMEKVPTVHVTQLSFAALRPRV